MRICVYNNLANNAYILVKFLRKKGYDAYLGLDPDDTFPMSQPIWEDLDFEIQLEKYTKKPFEFLSKTKYGKSYTYPKWVHEIGKLNTSQRNFIKSNLVAFFKHPIISTKALIRNCYGFFELLYTFLNLTKITDLAKYDFIIAYGMGPWLSFSASVKYASIPYGADLTDIPFQTNNTKWVIRTRAKLQRLGYKNSDYTFIGYDQRFPEALKKIGVFKKTFYLNRVPIDLEKYKPHEKEPLEILFDKSIANRIQNKIIFLMPSRIDFQVKGSDKALHAFAKLIREKPNVFLVMLGWGNDLDKAKKLVLELGIEKNVYFHEYIVSKPRLIRLINSADIVLDQFSSVSMIGTTSLETMAIGKPLLTHIDKKSLSGVLPEFPPVINAKDEDEIYKAMLELYNHEKRELLGAKGRDWMKKNYSGYYHSDIIKILKIEEDK